MIRKAWVEALQYVLIIAILVINIIGIIKLQHYVQEGRRANIERQDRIIEHVDCVLLLTKKYPNINFQALGYQESKMYLDKCAKVQ